MSLATYSDLKTAVAAWLNRSDLTSVIPDFIALCEGDLRVDLRVIAMEQYTTGTLTGETLAHPTRYMEARALTVGDTLYEYVPPERYMQYTASSGAKIFTSIGTNLYILNGTSGASYKLVYYQGFAAFSGASDTNWVLTNAPDVYLAGASRYGAEYLKDFELAQRFAVRYAGAVARVVGQQKLSASPGSLRTRVA